MVIPLYLVLLMVKFLTILTICMVRDTAAKQNLTCTYTHQMNYNFYQISLMSTMDIITKPYFPLLFAIKLILILKEIQKQNKILSKRILSLKQKRYNILLNLLQYIRSI